MDSGPAWSSAHDPTFIPTACSSAGDADLTHTSSHTLSAALSHLHVPHDQTNSFKSFEGANTFSQHCSNVQHSNTAFVIIDRMW